MNTEDRKFQAPAVLTSMSYTKDGGVRLGFTTQELSDEDKLIAAKFHQKFGYLLFKSNEFSPSDVPTEDADDATKKPSKRLRAVLFKRWQQAPKGDFEVFYREEMERIIGMEKVKLDD